MTNEHLTALCRGCDKPIAFDALWESVCLQIWSPRLGRYVHEGPFHPECAKTFNTTERTV